MAIQYTDKNTAIKTVTPLTDFTWVKSKAAPSSETLSAQKDGYNIIIDATAAATTIDYSKSTFDNIIDASASTTVKAITGGTGYDVIIGSSTLKSTLTAGATGADIIAGAGDDKLFGGAGNDNLAGGLGKNTFTGAAGADLFTSTGTDTITDLGNGADSLYVGSTGVTTATLAANFVATSVTQNNGTATLSDKGGFNVDLSKAVFGTKGFTVDAGKASAGVILTGSTSADSLIGGAGNDSINGGNGNTLTGGKGDDTFTFTTGTTNSVTDLGVGNDVLVVNKGAIVNATAAKGFTATAATVVNGTLNVTGVKTLNLSAATGTGTIVVTGSDGKDTLSGAIGATTLNGGAGDDTYVVISAADVVVEASGAGTDTVKSSINYTLVANVENLILTGTDKITGTGNDLVNKITANDAGSTLVAGSGVATLVGGKGDDTFVINNTADVVIDKSGGNDTIESSVTYTLSANIENLTLTGTADINGTGNKSVNTLNGNEGKNVLTAGAGNATINGNGGDDILVGSSKGTSVIDGGAGNDVISGAAKGGANTFTGGLGSDTFVFVAKQGATTITDFVSGTDSLQIGSGAVKGLVVGAVASTAFVSNTTGLSDSAAHHFIYNSSTGGLYFDADGSATKSAPVLIETLGVASHPALAAADITIIA